MSARRHSSCLDHRLARASAACRRPCGAPLAKTTGAGTGGSQFEAGHAAAGVTSPALEWFLAEGATGDYFDLFVLIANPSDRAADIDATFLLPDGSSATRAYAVPASSRFNIWVDRGDARLADTAVSITTTPSATAQLLFDDGGAAEKRTFTVPARSRFNVDVRSEFPAARGRGVGALIEGGPGALLTVERSIYSDASGIRWAAGSSAQGTRLQ